MVKKVDFFIVGEPKSGTTALAHYLSEHPEIFMSTPKEPNYFATDLIEESDEFHGGPVEFPIRTLKKYSELFEHSGSRKVLGEASTSYLFSKEAAKNIHLYNPDAKIIILLREPVSFMHSLHMQFVNETTEDEPDFAKALNKEKERKKGKHIPTHARAPSLLYYSERIKYSEQIERFLRQFPRNNILIFTTDEFKKDNRKVYGKVLSLVGADTSFEAKFEPVHESKKPRFAFINQILHNPKLRKITHKILGAKLYTYIHKNLVDKILLKKQSREPLSDKMQQELQKKAESEVKKLNSLLKRDFAKEWEYKS